MTKKITIEVSDEVHNELLKIQLDKRLKEGGKKPIAVVVAEVLNETLVKTKKAAN